MYKEYPCGHTSGRYYHLCPEGEDRGRPCSLRHENEPEHETVWYCCSPGCCERDIEEAEARCDDLAERRDRHQGRRNRRRGDDKLLREIEQHLAEAERRIHEVRQMHEACAIEHARRDAENERMGSPVFRRT